MKLKPLLTAAAAFVCASLACNAPSASQATPTDFVMVPGPTEASETPAQTVTAIAATPTTGAAAQCPAAGSATLPSAPPAFGEYADTIQAYLSGGGSVEGLESTLASWEGIMDQVGGVVRDRDLTGDGTPEVVVGVQAPISQFPNSVFPPGDLYIFGCSEGGYAVLFGDYATGDRPTPDIVAVEDLNQNGRADVVYTNRICGAHTCDFDVFAIEWDAASSAFTQLLLDVAGVPSATVTVENEDGGTSEIVVENGGIGSVGAGPQVVTQDTYVWNGSAFTFGGSEITSPVDQWYPIHYVMIADDHMDAGEYDAAISRYEEMIGLTEPNIWNSADEFTALQAYARFRIMVAHVLRGDSAAAQAVYEALFAEYDADPAKAGSGFAAMADIFWNTVLDDSSVGFACEAVAQYAEANPTSYEVLNQFGYANKVYDPATLCPFE